MSIVKETKKSYGVNTTIPELEWHELNDNGIEQYCKNILNIRNVKNIEKSTGQGFAEPLCYDYVFNNCNDTDFFADVSLYDYLHNNYKRITIKNSKKGDIITYENKNEITHYAKIYKTNGTLKGTIIRSKWGTMGVFETDLYSIPESYGKIIKIWRKI